MIRRLLLLPLVAVSFLAIPAVADDARRAMDRGRDHYEAGDFDAAIESFNDASQAAEEEKLDRAHALYNLGNAFTEKNEYGQASDIYLQALRSRDLDLQARAYFNRGNAMAALAQKERSAGQFEEALKYIDEAGMMYENAMMLTPDDEDPKVNYELLAQMEQQVQQEKQEQEQQQQSQEQQQGDGEDGENQQDTGNEGQPGENDEMSEGDQQEGDSGDSQQSEQGPQQLLSSEEATTEKMTEQEAFILLDALREEEKANRSRMRVILGQQVPVEKDW